MSAALFVADALVLAGLSVLTLAVWGVLRLPDTFARLHAASKAAALGVGLLLLSSLTTGQVDMMVRALVVLVFLSITAPVGAHAIARLEHALRTGKLPALLEPLPKLPPFRQRSPRTTAGSSRASRPDPPPPEGGQGEGKRS